MAIALFPDRPLEPDVLAVAVLITVGVAVAVVGTTPGEVSPPPSDPPDDGDGDTGGVAVGAADVVLAVVFLPPAAASAAAGSPRTAPSSPQSHNAAQRRTIDRLTSTEPSALGRERLLHRGRGRRTLVGILVLLVLLVVDALHVDRPDVVV